MPYSFPQSPIRDSATLTYLLNCWSQGDREAAARLMPQVYDELHRIARAYFRSERSDHTLQPTALVNEVYLRLDKGPGKGWDSRTHFYGIAACAMRRVLVDHGRRHRRLKRGGGQAPLSLSVAGELPLSEAPELAAVAEALETLERIDPQKAILVELRFFGGLRLDEIAECLGVAPITVSRQWRRAKAWLHRELSPASP